MYQVLIRDSLSVSYFSKHLVGPDPGLTYVHPALGRNWASAFRAQVGPRSKICARLIWIIL